MRDAPPICRAPPSPAATTASSRSPAASSRRIARWPRTPSTRCSTARPEGPVPHPRGCAARRHHERPADGERPRPDGPPRRCWPLEVMRRGRCRSRPCSSRWCPACRTCGPRRSTRPAHEMARDLDDVLTRRTRARLLDRDAPCAAAADDVARCSRPISDGTTRRPNGRSPPSGRAAPMKPPPASFPRPSTSPACRHPAHQEEPPDRDHRPRPRDHPDRRMTGPMRPTRRSSSPARLAQLAATAVEARPGSDRSAAGRVPHRALRSPSAPRRAATGGRSRCTGRSPAQVPQLAAIVCSPADDRRGRGRAARLPRARVPVTPAAGPQRCVRRVGARVRWRAARPVDLHGVGRGRRRVGRGRGARRHVRPRPRARARSDHGLTVGHFPQSFDLATVGGWVACRGAGQYSTRYGKIEDMVVGLEVVLADGTVVRTGGAPAAAVGPDLTQLFVGSEGTLGVVTRVWLRTHAGAPHRRWRRTRSPTFETASRPAAGSCAEAPHRRCCACTTHPRAPAARAATAPSACCSCSTRATG
jgi:hypothetical protein